MDDKTTADKVLPFITTVANDIYEKVDDLTNSIVQIGEMLKQIDSTFQENLNKLTSDINEMLEETRMNRELTLEAFSDSMNAMLMQIKEIQEEKTKGFKGGGLESILYRIEQIANKINEKYWDIQMMLTTSNLHTLIDVLKGNTQVITVEVPTKSIEQPVTRRIITPKPTKIQAPVETGPEDEEKHDVFAKSPKFKGGRKLKTHDERLEEMKRKKKLFGKY